MTDQAFVRTVFQDKQAFFLRVSNVHSSSWFLNSKHSILFSNFILFYSLKGLGNF